MRINEFTPNPKIFEGMSLNKNNDTENIEEDKSFTGLLKKQLDSLNDKQIKSEMSTEAFIKGEETNIHNVMINAEEAKMSLELAVQVRNKIIEAYQELSRMQL
ncbi:flagellar hook-basal body complex protein FliE [Clostridium sp. MSJ-11]|uniref:Flagellar hook-basal body complex protein FliE n=1 Tax=Clostridium mobile TaxID=2841512 RepID=A0ABS6ECW9_9CLOT|nr:flagellar hook-basal body complex protein FliE [Clostridium mobile]MBU5483038.1 flagellar hook-basal body complex protein FliE [Clostridium mobile]